MIYYIPTLLVSTIETTRERLLRYLATKIIITLHCITDNSDGGAWEK